MLSSCYHLPKYILHIQTTIIISARPSKPRMTVLYTIDYTI